MKIGVSRPTQGIEDSRAMFRLAQACGFKGVQCKPGQYGGMTPEEFTQSHGHFAQLARAGLIVYCPADLSTWQAQLRPVFDFAGQVGAEQVCVCAGIRRSASGGPHHAETAAVLNACGVVASARGVRLSLHNHADSLFESMDDIFRMADLLDPGHCGLTLDTAHFAKAGVMDTAALIPRIKTHLVNVHLKDIDDTGKFCPVGRGTLDLRSVADSLQTEGYAHWLIVDEESMDVAPEEAFAVSFDYLREILKL